MQGLLKDENAGGEVLVGAVCVLQGEGAVEAMLGPTPYVTKRDFLWSRRNDAL